MRRHELGVLVPLAVWLSIKLAVLPLLTLGSERIEFHPSLGGVVVCVGPRVLAVAVVAAISLATLGWPSLRASIRTS